MADIAPAQERVVEMTDDAAQAVDPAADRNVVVIGDEDGELPKRAVRNADGSITLPLLYPVMLQWKKPGGETRTDVFDELRMHRLTGADMRAIASTSKDNAGVVAIAKSARMTEGKMRPIYDRMDAADTTAAESVIAFLLGTGARAGR